MSEEDKKIDPDLKKELLKKTKEDGFHTVEEAAAKLEGKIPEGRPPDEDEE